MAFQKQNPNEQLIQLDVCAMNSEGQGVARVDGLTVFVPGAIAGDQVEGIIEQRKSNYAVARMKRLLTPSVNRIQPFCAVAAKCGGCTLQPMRYTAQLQMKHEQVIAALTRIGGFAQISGLVRPMLGMKNPYAYRSKVQFPVSGSSNRPKIGFFSANSHTVVDHCECGIQHPVADVVRATIRAHCQNYHIAPYDELTHQGLLRHIVIRIGFATGQVMVILVINGDEWPGLEQMVANLQDSIRDFQEKRSIEDTDDSGKGGFSLHSLYLNHHQQQTNLVLSENMTLIFGEPKIEERLLGLRYAISPLAFFQVNPVQTEVLYQTVRDFAGLTGKETVFDLYCGAGSIALLLAQHARQVIGVEIVPQAIEDAIYNAQINGLSDQVQFLAGKAEEILPDLAKDDVQADVVIVDPPRKGCDSRLLGAILRILPQRLIYVSCDPATLARDLAYLSRDGKYQISAVQPVDMFPWTTHVETVVMMSRVEKQ